MFAKFRAWLGHQREAEKLTYDHQLMLISGRQFAIRQATFTDIATIIEIERQIYGTAPWNANAFQIELERNRDRLYLVAVYDGQIVAYIGCSFNWYKQESHITNIGVLPAYQGHGIGSRLIELLKEYAAQHGYSRMTLEVRVHNLRARKLYEQQGFRQIKLKPRYYIDNREDAVEMEVKLYSRGERR